MATTGGDPSSASDDRKPLIYGGRDPWTSFSTVRVDEVNYIFGGTSNRRAGKKAIYGQVVIPPVVSDDSIVTSVILGDIEVTQRLSIMNSTTTGRPDSVLVEYLAENKGTLDRSIGVRLVFDTMLGMNDGAPFRIPDGPVTRAMVLTGKNIPELWQAFDSLRTPTLRAQGTLEGDILTRPDQVVFADWGTLADDPWTVDVDSTKGFIRKGEDEPDTATALLWLPETIHPGELFRFATLYGLGGITVSQAEDLMLGVTSPAEVSLRKKETTTVPIVAYIENGTPKDIRDMSVSIHLPAGVVLAEGQSATKTFPRLSAFSDLQCGWTIKPTLQSPQELVYEVTVVVDSKVVNRVTRSMKVKTPPVMVLWVNGGPVDGLDGVFQVKAAVKNMSDRRAERVVLTIEPPLGFAAARNEILTRPIGVLEPGRLVSVLWTFYSKSNVDALPIAVSVVSDNALDVSQSRTIRLK